MSLIDFIIGVVVGFSGAFLTGVTTKASEDFYKKFIKKYIFPTQQFVPVGKSFTLEKSKNENLAWISEDKLYEYEAQGYKFKWIDKKKNACYRMTSDGSRNYKEYLMFK